MKNTPNDPNDWTFLGNKQLMSRKMHRKASVFWYPKGHPLDSVQNSQELGASGSSSAYSNWKQTWWGFGCRVCRKRRAEKRRELSWTDDDGCGSEITLMAARFGQISSSLLPTGLKEAMICVLGGLAGCEKSLLMFVYFCYFVNFPFRFSGQIWPA